MSRESKIESKIIETKYETLQLIGKGSSSSVYLVRHRKLLKILAMKIIQKDAMSRFQHQQEVLILKSISNSGIPELFDFEEDSDHYYIIEEFIPGRSLQSILKQSISQEQFIHYSLQMAELLHKLHEYEAGPILYLDIKPSHFIVKEQQLYLVDYGLATLTQSGRAEQVWYGTKAYAAPETISDHTASISSDVYSLGILLKEMYAVTEFRKNTSVKRSVMDMIEQMTHPNPDIRYDTLYPVIRTLSELEKQRISKTVGHLNKKIAVVGSDTRVGTTFVATILTSSLNQNHISACYRETEQLRWLNESSMTKDRGICFAPRWRGSFKGIPEFGPFVDCDEGKEYIADGEIQVCDLGVYRKEDNYEEYDLLLVVLGARPWEQGISQDAVTNGKRKKNCKYVCSLVTKQEAKELAICIKREVMHIPSQENPYRPGKRIGRKIVKYLKEDMRQDMKQEVM